VVVIVEKESWSRRHNSSPLLRCGKFCFSFDDILESKYLLDFGEQAMPITIYCHWPIKLFLEFDDGTDQRRYATNV
jgi:hypothetical protein